MTLKGFFQKVMPLELKAPTHLPRRLLARLGYYRLRTWMANYGTPVADGHLYQPLFSPWEGEAAFEPLFRLIQPHTLVSRDRCYLLWKTLRQAMHLPGVFLECGVFRGGTALLAAETMRACGDARPLHLFDSFEGMPATTPGIDRFEKGDFHATSADQVKLLLKPYPFAQVHVGFIPDTFAGLPIDRVAWAHVDVDIYRSVHDSIDYVYPRLVPGGFLIFDDYGFPSCSGARRAVDEAFADRPEVPLCLPTGQCLVIKLGPCE
jgi:O-methyltransferase